MFISRVLFAATGAVAVNALTDQCDSGDEMCLVSVEAQKVFEAAEAEGTDTDLMQESTDANWFGHLPNLAYGGYMRTHCGPHPTGPAATDDHCEATEYCEENKNRLDKSGYCQENHNKCVACHKKSNASNAPSFLIPLCMSHITAPTMDCSGGPGYSSIPFSSIGSSSGSSSGTPSTVEVSPGQTVTIEGVPR